jgi:hypothetical protein
VKGVILREPPKKQPTKEELANFKDNIFWNTTRAATDAYLAKLDAQGVDTSEMRAHAEASACCWCAGFDGRGRFRRRG